MNIQKGLVLFISLVLLSCANKFSLENKVPFKIDDIYYEKWTAGIKGGGSGLYIYLTIESDATIEDNTIQLIGVYFREGYCVLKKNSNTFYQGFIKTNENSERVELDITNKNTTIDKPDNIEIPFDLKKDEAVISYYVGSKRKYYKVIIKQKNLETFPM